MQVNISTGHYLQLKNYLENHNLRNCVFQFFNCIRQETNFNFGDGNCQQKIGEETLRLGVIRLCIQQRNYQKAYQLIQDGRFSNNEKIVAMWDEAHYKEYSEDIKRDLNSVMKFRLRQRFPPPLNLNGSGQRQKKSFTNKCKKILIDWLDRNASNPYPDANEVEMLAYQCNITTKQVRIWFTNARRRNDLFKNARKAKCHVKMKTVNKNHEAQLRNFPNLNNSPGKYHLEELPFSPSKFLNIPANESYVDVCRIDASSPPSTPRKTYHTEEEARMIALDALYNLPHSPVKYQQM